MNFEGIDLQKALDLSEEVYSKHLPGYTIGKGNTKSPFHRDSLPSFSVKFYNGKYRWKDFVYKERKNIFFLNFFLLRRKEIKRS